MNFKTIEYRQYKAEQAYGESTENLPMTKAYKFYILLDAVDSNTTNVRVINIIKLTWLGRLMKKSVFKKIKKNWAGKLKNLEELGQKFQTNSI
jgi:tRNA A22 N-methylase